MISNKDKNSEQFSDRVSVVIPHYNSSETIFRAVRSALAQTYEVLEIIVIDDCSDRAHKERLEGILALDPKVRLLTLEHNQGPGAARNAGWDSAQGDWVSFLDSDDAWHPRKLEIQIGVVALLGEAVDMIGAEAEVVGNGEDIPISLDLGHFSIDHLSTWQLLFSNRLQTSTVVVRTGLSQRFTNGRRYSEDYETWLRISATNKSIIQLKAPLVYSFKEPYGESGLSSHMLSMSWGEVVTFWRLYRSEELTTTQFSIASIWSFVKSVKRLSTTAANRTYRRVRSLR